MNPVGQPKMMIAPLANPKEAQIEELKAFISKERDGRQVKKALAVKLLYQGHTFGRWVGGFHQSGI